MCGLLPLFLCAAQPVSGGKIPYDLHPEHDKTDIFAIPLDDSEEEENQEMAELEALQEKQQNKKK